MKRTLLIALAAVSLLPGQAPDNTKANQDDKGVTADSQKMNKEERALAQKVRKSVYADKSLSTYAHNVKIIVHAGEVTLKGPVRSQAEKDAIEQKAAAIAGVKNVSNQLEIAPAKE